VEVDGVRARGIGFGLGASLPQICEQPSGRILGAQFRVDEWQGSLRPEFVVEAIGDHGEGLFDGSPPREGCLAGCPYQATPFPDEAHTRREGFELKPVPSLASQEGASGSLSLPRARDLRDERGRVSAIAQVLASGERTMLLTCSIAGVLPAIGARLPLPALCGELLCYGRSCEDGGTGRLADARVAVVEWEVAGRALGRADAPVHAIALDPPFRRGHVTVLRALVDAGATLHLCYGKEEREATARLLRHLVHPRFAMVCLYRAIQEGERSQEELMARAAAIGWREAGVALARPDLSRAAEILGDLGVGRLSSLEAKLELRAIPAYAAAEADYEECTRLCLTL
jgi:hypothetical protein